MEYKSNSHKQKEATQATEEKRAVPVVSGNVKTKKKGDVAKLVSGLIVEDVSKVRKDVWTDTLIPKAQQLIVDVIYDFASLLFLGGTKGKKSSGSGQYVSYRNYSDSRDDRRHEVRPLSRFDLDDIIFDNSRDAVAVREQMNDILNRYGFVTVADLYESVELSAPYTANNYGWTSLRNADIVHTRDGWVIKLPKPTTRD